MKLINSAQSRVQQQLIIMNSLNQRELTSIKQDISQLLEILLVNLVLKPKVTHYCAINLLLKQK
jgi:hypothetical protein